MRHLYALLISFFAITTAFAQCNYELVLQDNFGQGWASTPGAGVNVTINGGTPTFYTISTAGSAPNIRTFSIAVGNGDSIIFDYTPPNPTGDGQWSLRDSEGISVYNSGFNPGANADFTGTAVCPTCPAVTMLTVATVSANSAEIGWTNGGAETEWEIEYGISPYTAGTGGTIVPVTSNPSTISGLSSVTTYDVYVRAKCGTDLSSSRGPITFTTTESCPAPSGITPITNTSSSISFIWDSNGNNSANANIQYGVSPFALNGPNMQTTMQPTAPFADVTGLMSDTSYDFYVQIDCGNGDLSTWAGPYTARTLISCFPVNALQVDFAGVTEADISWTAGQAGTSWEVEYAAAGVITQPGTMQGTLVNVTTPSINIAALTQNTTYDVYVRELCDPALPDYSSRRNISFTTQCTAIAATTAVPYVDDFETFAANLAFERENCWSATFVSASGNRGYDWNITTTGTTPSSGTGPNNANSGTKYFYIETLGANGDTATLFSPIINIDGLTNPSVQFYYHLFGPNMGNLSVDIYDGTAWQTGLFTSSGPVQTSGADPFEQAIIDLSGYTGDIQVRFVSTRVGFTTGDMAIDDFSVQEAPACAPVGIISTGTLNATDAEVSWQTQGSETSWIVEYGPVGFTPGTSATDPDVFEVTVTTNPYTITGLDPNSNYDVYVTADCGMGSLSAQKGPASFTTAFLPPQGVACTGMDNVFVFQEEFENNDNGWTGNIGVGTTTNALWNFNRAISPTSTNTGPDAPFSGGGFAYLETSGNVTVPAAIVSPAIDLSFANTGAELSFYYFAYGAEIDEFQVNVGPSATGPWTNEFTAVGQLQTAGSDPWAPVGVNLDAYVGQVIYIQITGKESAVNGFTADIAIDLLKIETCGAFCSPPNMITATNITDTTVDISFVDTNATPASSFEVLVLPAGSPAPDASTTGVQQTATASPYNWTGLTAFTDYEIYVRTDCMGASGFSVWSGPLAFQTACATFTAPYFTNFENFSPTLLFVEENCWTGDADTAYDWNVDNAGSTPSTGTGPLAAFSGTTYFYVEASSGAVGNEARIVSPLIDISPLTTASIQFKYHMFGAQTGTLHVDVNDGTGWINDVGMLVGQQQATQAEDWRDGLFDLSSVTLASNIIQVRLRATSNGTFAGDISVDDFRVDNIPTCPNITLLSSGVVNSSSVEINWTAGGTESEWVVEYRTVGATAFTALTPNPTTPTATITNLNSGTDYEFCVKAVCGAGDESQQTCINVSTSPDYCAGDIFVDSGGISGDYQNNENITYNICPDNAGDVVYVNFTFNDMEDSTTGCFDGLTIYDGPDTTFPTINTPTGGTEWCWDPNSNTGTGNLVGELLIGTSTSGCITLVFSSDGSVQRPGWAATVTCAPPPTCPSPTALDVTSATDTTASLVWTAGGTETAWDVEVGLPGFAPNTGASVIPVVNVTTSPATTVTGLTADTTYEYYVRAVCGQGDESIYIGPFTFKTECAPLTAPYIEDFETFTANLLFTEQNCWKANSNSTTFTAWDWNLDAAGGTPTANTGPDTAFNGTNYFYIEGNGGAAGNEANLLSPLVNVSSLTNPSMQFRYHMFGAATGILHVDINDGTGFVNDVVIISGQQQTSGAAPWELVVVDLSAFASGSIQARFRAERTDTGFSGTSDIALDNVVFDEAPTCAQPSILTVANTTDVSTELSWNENGSATSWIVEYGPCGFTPGTMAAGAVTVTASTNSGFMISGLTSATCYDYYVTADCGMGTLSGIAGPSRFSTALTGPVGVTCTTGNPYFVWTEGFNTIATNWTGDVGTGTTNGDWNFGRATAPGSTGTGPSGPFEGNGFLYFETSGTNVGPARVVSPPIDLTGSVNDELELSFYYHAFGGDATIVNVEYGTSPTGPWTSVFTYTGQIQTSATQPFQAVGAMLPSTLIGQIIYIRISGTEAPGGETGFVGDIAIDQMRIETCGTFCAPPLVISAGATTDTTATINWTSPASVTAWEYVNQPAGTGLPTAAGTPVTAATAMITGLTAATNYEFYVRSDCGGGFFSTWVGPFNYSTECSSFNAPYTTGFENFTITTAFVEQNCWTTPQVGAVFSWDTRTGTTPSTATGPSAAATGTNYFYTEASTGTPGSVAELVSPLVNLAGFTSPTLTFNYHMFGADITALRVDVNDGTTWTNDVFVLTGQQQTATGDAWRNASVPLAAFTGNTIQVRFRVIRGASFNGDVAIDDIVIDGTAGIDSLESLGFTYYPNPTQDIVQFNGVQPINTISVRNMLGQVIETINVDALNTQISLASYASGIYLVEVRTAGRTGVVRIIKE